MASPSTSASIPAVEERPEGPGDELQMRERRDETKWKRNLAKRKRNSGQEYVGLNTGKTVAAKQIGPFPLKLTRMHAQTYNYQHYTLLVIAGRQSYGRSNNVPVMSKFYFFRSEKNS